jgi:steroid delta-isomerase-like uncharacterized protein
MPLPSPPTTETGTVTTPTEALAEALDRWNAGDLDGYLRLYDDSIRLHGYAAEPMNKTEVRAFYESIFAAFDSPSLVFHDVLWDHERCAIRFVMNGEHHGEFMGVPATGAAISLSGITILHFTGDRVTERFSQADMLGLLVQIGAVPAPA